MASLEQLADSVASLGDLQVIVRTMKALSAASIRQYEQAAQALTDYYRTVELGLHVVLRDRKMPREPSPRADRPEALVVFGSDHGLCGRFNEDIVEHVDAYLRASRHTERLLLAVGGRVAARLMEVPLQVQQEFRLPGSAARISATIGRILLTIDEWRTHGGVERVTVFHNGYLSSSRYSPTLRVMLPVDLMHFQRLEQQPWPSRVLPTYSMHPERLFSSLLRQYLFVTLFRACAESQASEQASRLAAMRAAERNLEERADDVGRQYRLARQGQITGELLDVVAGFEALADSRSA
jgi:F-type H+-transporting ATPase subunit gamma